MTQRRRRCIHDIGAGGLSASTLPRALRGTTSERRLKLGANTRTGYDEAARKATRYMIDYLVATRGLSRAEAYMPCSLAGDLTIAETVDIPHMLVTMHMPKGIFVDRFSDRR